MRLGLVTPVVLQVPGVASEWERGAGPEDIATIAATADRLGFDHLTCAEHVAVPHGDTERGTTYWDPLATLSFLAARTSRIRLTTSVLVLGYHHPLEIAKRYGTLDRLSGGRLVLGVGVGSLRTEFDVLGAQFEDRGARADDSLRALRASFGRERVSYRGSHFRYDEMVVQPCGVQERVPIWVGGHTRRSLRRATEFGDGWMPFGLRYAAISEMLAALPPPPGFEIVLSTGRAVDPEGDPAGTTDRLRRLRDAGATLVSCVVASRSADHYCAQLTVLRELADRLGGETA